MSAVSTAVSSSPPRSRFKQFAGRAVSSLLKLPPHTTEYTVHHGLRVPMRDGVDLIADHYEPATTTPAGTLLVRGPYGRGCRSRSCSARVYAARGYHVVFQSVRGTFGSGGEFSPMVHEIADGADTVAWLRDQPWFTGSFATIGLSYLGFTQWALLTDPPPEMAAAVITVGPHDFSAPRWGTGSFALNDFLGWSDMVSHQEEPGFAPRLVVGKAAKRHSRQATERAAGRRGGPGAARHGRAVVRILARASRPRRPALGPLQLHRGAGAHTDSGPAAQRVAGPVPRADAGAVPAPA